MALTRLTQPPSKPKCAQGYGKEADAILAVYPHATDEQATRAATELSNDTRFDWGQYTWARLQAANGKHTVHVYYFDRPSARDPNGSTHGQEVGYVFGNLGVADDPSRRRRTWLSHSRCRAIGSTSRARATRTARACRSGRHFLQPRRW